MVAAISSNGGIKGVKTSVVSVDMSEEKKTKTKILNISQMNNISFEQTCVRFRKAFRVGKGLCMANEEFKDKDSLKGFQVTIYIHPILLGEYITFIMNRKIEHFTVHNRKRPMDME